jgi:hypothetical protein
MSISSSPLAASTSNTSEATSITCPVTRSKHESVSSSHFHDGQPLGINATIRHRTPSSPSVKAREAKAPNRSTTYPATGEKKSLTVPKVERKATT